MSARTLAVACIAASALAPPAWACGACAEDKIAVTYDHAVVAHAAERHHVVVFAAIEGRGDVKALARAVKAAALRTPGVDRESVRTAADPAAVSFALDPRVAAPEQRSPHWSARQPGLKLTMLRIAR
jgi:hypothetical protein